MSSAQKLSRNHQRHSRLRIVLIAVLAAVLAGAAAFMVYVSIYYHGEPAAVQAMASNETISVYELRDGVTVFAPEEPQAGFIFISWRQSGTYRLRTADACLCRSGHTVCSGPHALQFSGVQCQRRERYSGTVPRDQALVHWRALSGRRYGCVVCGGSHR